MTDERVSERVAPMCRWRTSAETLDLIEALERIEALLLRLDERMREADAREPAATERGAR